MPCGRFVNVHQNAFALCPTGPPCPSGVSFFVLLNIIHVEWTYESLQLMLNVCVWMFVYVLFSGVGGEIQPVSLTVVMFGGVLSMTNQVVLFHYATSMSLLRTRVMYEESLNLLSSESVICQFCPEPEWCIHVERDISMGRMPMVLREVYRVKR